MSLRRGAAFNFLTPYFTDWLRWTGIEDITEIHFQPNLATDDVEAHRQAAHAAARRTGALFGRRPTVSLADTG